MSPLHFILQCRKVKIILMFTVNNGCELELERGEVLFNIMSIGFWILEKESEKLCNFYTRIHEELRIILTVDLKTISSNS